MSLFPAHQRSPRQLESRNAHRPVALRATQFYRSTHWPNEALEKEDLLFEHENSKTKHPELENETLRTRKWSKFDFDGCHVSKVFLEAKMAKFGQFSRLILKKIIWVSGVILPPAYCLLLIVPPKKNRGQNYYGMRGIQEDKGVVIPPQISISPQI